MIASEEMIVTEKGIAEITKIAIVAVVTNEVTVIDVVAIAIVEDEMDMTIMMTMATVTTITMTMTIAIVDRVE